MTHGLELSIINGGPQAAATLKELRFPSPGLRAKHATLYVDKERVDKGKPASSGNSKGVEFPQPRVAGEARYPG